MLTVTKRPAAPNTRVCPACRTGPLHEAQRERLFHPHSQTLVVPLLTSICDHCGAEATSAAQNDENLRRLAERKAHYGGLLLGEDILALRRRYGLTQQLASRIFGKGKIASSRYERETTYPDASTTLLISLAIAWPDALKWLAKRRARARHGYLEGSKDGARGLFHQQRLVHAADSVNRNARLKHRKTHDMLNFSTFFNMLFEDVQTVNIWRSMSFDAR